MFFEEGATKGRSEAGYWVAFSTHGAINKIIVFDNKSYFRVTVTLYSYFVKVISVEEGRTRN
jgi:hypothetical protein